MKLNHCVYRIQMLVLAWVALPTLTWSAGGHYPVDDAEPEAQLGLRWAFDHPIELLDVAVARPLRGDEKDWALTVGLTVTF